MRNVEIKAKVKNLGDLIEKAKELSCSSGEIIKQNDTFYNTQNGRLKLRKFSTGNAELIYYDRPDIEGPKLCSYEKCDLVSQNVDGLQRVLNAALGSKIIVNKHRQLFIVGQTRIHIDSVDNLGDFMELEVVLNENQTPLDGEKVAFDLMAKLNIQKSDLVSGAYADLLDKHNQK